MGVVFKRTKNDYKKTEKKIFQVVANVPQVSNDDDHVHISLISFET
jgi:hypothetical protein